MQASVARGRRLAAKIVVALAVLSAAAVSAAPVAESQTNPYERGPDPTVQRLEARSGPYSVSQSRVSSSVRGFGGGTVYYPSTTSDGTFGAVAISPGYTASQSSMSWFGPRLASHGFVVFTIDTNSRFDQPSSRARQLQAALDYLVSSSSSVRNRIDASRLGVMGHSMGGGGSLIASRDNPQLKASIPLAPWNTSSRFSTVRVPTLIIACERDATASVRSHASPMYNSIPNSTNKGFIEIAGGNHFCPNSTNTTIGRYSVAWLKRFIDNDTRYDPFLCGQPHRDAVRGRAISDNRDTCPY